MSRDALQQIAESEVFQASLPPSALTPMHVPFDVLVGESRTEAVLARAAASAAANAVCIIGTSGSGKSSVIAYELGPLSDRAPERLLPLRVPMAIADPAAVSSPADFARHIVAYITRVAAAEIVAERDRERIERRAAEQETSRRQGFRASARLAVPIIGPELSLDLESGGQEFVRRVNAGEAVGAMNDLAAVFRSHGREPLLVFDDTDVWLESAYGVDEARRLATEFFGRNLVMLKREVDCGFVVVAHERYLDHVGFHDVLGRFDYQITIPRFPDPEDALRRIFAKRLEVAALGIALGDLLAAEAITTLAAFYDVGPAERDLRALVGIAEEAVRQALEDPVGPDVVGAAAIRAAAGRRLP